MVKILIGQNDVQYTWEDMKAHIARGEPLRWRIRTVPEDVAEQLEQVEGSLEAVELQASGGWSEKGQSACTVSQTLVQAIESLQMPS